MIIADDIMVIGYQKDEQDHDIAFTKLLETANKNNIKLNFDKIQYKQREVEFFGKIYTTQGCKPSDTKVKAITENMSERHTSLPRNGTISEQILSKNCRNC